MIAPVHTSVGDRCLHAALSRWQAAVALAIAGLLCSGCGEHPAPLDSVSTRDATIGEVHAPPLAGPRVVFLGDSLTAASGLPVDEGYPARISDLLAAEGTPVQVVNAGVGGDTSAGGLSRLAWVLAQKPDIVVVELGANDGLRGQPPAAIEANLRAIIEGARAKGAKVLLVGMRLPPNFGADYVREFEAVYPRLARELDVPLVPFLLDGVATIGALNLEDGMHPNAEGYKRVAENVLQYLRPLVLAR